MELVGGIIMIVISVIMLVIGTGILGSISSNGSIGDCDKRDWDGNGYVSPAWRDASLNSGAGGWVTDGSTAGTASGDYTALSLDAATQGYKGCKQAIDTGFITLGIMSVMLIVTGVILSIRGIQS